MYGVIRRYRLADGASAEEVLQRVQQGFVPIVSQTPGFLAYHAVDLGDGRVVSVGVFDGPESAQESSRRAADYVRRELSHFFAGPPEIEQGAVGAHAVRETNDAPELASGQQI